jgi:hypothetical protein
VPTVSKYRDTMSLNVHQGEGYGTSGQQTAETLKTSVDEYNRRYSTEVQVLWNQASRTFQLICTPSLQHHQVKRAQMHGHFHTTHGEDPRTADCLQYPRLTF